MVGQTFIQDEHSPQWIGGLIGLLVVTGVLLLMTINDTAFWGLLGTAGAGYVWFAMDLYARARERNIQGARALAMGAAVGAIASFGAAVSLFSFMVLAA